VVPGEEARLADRDAITDVLYRYARALDGRDWEALRTVFTEDAVGEYTGRINATFHGVAAIIGLVSRALGGLEASQHIIANPVIDVDGDEARSRCYLHAQHYRPARATGGSTYVVGGTYHDRLVRASGGWRIAHRRLEIAWMKGDIGVQIGYGDRG
jgi:3-phenylpropionate/cinnamic acid dioxygenase small subunit